MDWLRPICVTVNRRLGSSWPLRRTIEALTVIVFLAIASLIMGRRINLSKTLGHRSNCSFPAIFNFGDSNSDTGGKSAAFHRLPYPNGETFFHKPSGRYCDGKVIIDFIGENENENEISLYMFS